MRGKVGVSSYPACCHMGAPGGQRRLSELFVQLDGLSDPADVVQRAAALNIHFLPPDQWPADRHLPT